VAASFRLVDYSLRPAKHAERKMLCDAFRRLSKFASIESYQYVGFGSIWFSDFSMFHRQLGIEKMISIEREKQHSARFELNVPFGGVELRFGSSAAELPKIDWSLRSIVWLDYDDPLEPSMLSDVRLIAEKAISGTALTVSMQIESPPIIDKDGDKRQIASVEEFTELFGVKRTPPALEAGDFRGWKMADLARKMLLDEINDALRVINATRIPAHHISFKQIAAFDYQDGAKMATLSGVFVDKGQEPIFSSCAFSELAFFRPGAASLRIEVPKLTPREMRSLEKLLPIADPNTIQCDPMPKKDAVLFAQFYRYLPSFSSFEP